MTVLLSNAPADPATLFAEEVDDLFQEAKNWLDGEPIATEEQAEAVSRLLNQLRRAAKDADEARKAEKKPHDDAAKAVQAKWVPLIDKANLATVTARKALAPWLQAIEDKQKVEAEAARQEAERMAQLAREAHQKAGADLSAADDAERLLKASKAADRHASKAEKARPLATGGERAVGLVDVFTPELVNPADALRHYRTNYPDALKAWLVEQAERDVRSGARTIPGFNIKHERVAR